MIVGVAGAGAFGRAVAKCAARNGAQVRLWSRRAAALRGAVEAGVEPSEDPQALADAELVVIAIPTAHLHERLAALVPVLDGRHRVVHVSRGLLGEELTTVGDAVASTTAVRRVGVLAGPLTERVLSKGEPSGAVVGSEFPEVVEVTRAALGSASLRIYGSNDRRGVELASALTGLLFFVVGFARAHGARPGTIATLSTRGVAEIARLGKAMGARVETFSGLAGAGDLAAVLAGDARPEVDAAQTLATMSDLRLDEFRLEAIGIARRVAKQAHARHVAMPLLDAVVDVLERRDQPRDAIAKLMARPVGFED